MTLGTGLFLDELKAAAGRAEVAEGEFKKEVASRLAAFARERTFAFRRLNLMRAVADAIAEADNEETAVANGVALLRARLGWASDSEARLDVLSRFAPVARAMFRNLVPAEETPAATVQSALAEFESWYAETHPAPFWVLFEAYVAETPVVDF